MGVTANEAGQEWLDEFKPPERPQCSFMDIDCVRPDVGHLCGAFTVSMQRSKTRQAMINKLPTPCWLVRSTRAKLQIVPTQQLSLFDPPQVQYVHKPFSRGSQIILPYRLWHIAPYYCKYGRDWAIVNEKKMGALHIRVQEVRNKPGCKRKTQLTEYADFCI